MLGKALRMERLTHRESKRICLVPLDHGTTLGPIEGIRDYIKTMGQIIDGGADAIVVHKGLLKTAIQHKELLKGRYIMHLSASTNMGPNPSAKVLVGSVEEALKLGAEGVSIHVNLGCETESQMLRDLGKASAECHEWGMPLLVMMYIQLEDGKQSDNQIIHGVRIAEELGADMVKIDCLSTVESLRKLMNSVRIPVLVAGGAKADKPENLLSMIDFAVREGISGVAIGRNIFQYCKPGVMTEVVSKMVHSDMTLSEALLRLNTIQGVAV